MLAHYTKTALMAQLRVLSITRIIKKLGRESADHWLRTNFHDVNRRSTFDIDTLLLDTGSKTAPLLTWPDV